MDRAERFRVKSKPAGREVLEEVNFMLIWKQRFGKEKPVGAAKWDGDRDRREQGLGNAQKQTLWQRGGLGF